MSVIPFPLFNLTSVPESLRKLANDIETGQRDAVRVVVCMETSEGVGDYVAFGEDFTRAHAVGLCHIVAMDIVA